MNKVKLISFSNYDLYMVIDNDLTYYLSIPKIKLSCVLTIGIDSNAHILNSNINDINDSLKGLYSDFNNTNSVLLIPSIEKDCYKKLDDYTNTQLYNSFAKNLTKSINSAYKVLKDLNVEIDHNMKFIENKEIGFIDWFISRYNDRIKVMDLLDIISEYNLHKMIDHLEALRKVNAGGLNFIVGNVDETKNDNARLVEIKNPYDDFSQMYETESKTKRRDLATATGNISYYFIGTLVVITSLIILVLLIK